MARPTVPQRRSSQFQGLRLVLHLTEHQGQRRGGPILLAGMVLGAGVVALGSSPLGQTCRFSLELLVLQLVGPMLVMALLLPRWLEHAERRGARADDVATRDHGCHSGEGALAVSGFRAGARRCPAAGLRPGQEVRIPGLPVGQVTSLQLEPDARVLVRLQLAKRYAALIGPKRAASQSQEGLVGDHLLAIMT